MITHVFNNQICAHAFKDVLFPEKCHFSASRIFFTISLGHGFDKLCRGPRTRGVALWPLTHEAEPFF